MIETYTYTSSEFGDVRVLDLSGMPWFVGKDAAEAIGYGHAHNALRQHVDDEDKKLHAVKGAKRDMILINEAGLYSLIFSSKLQRARQFKRWITAEVLPTFRNAAADDADDPEEDKDLLSPSERLSLAKLIATAPHERIPAITQIVQPLLGEELDLTIFTTQIKKELLDAEAVIKVAYDIAERYGTKSEDGRYAIKADVFKQRLGNIDRLSALKILDEHGVLVRENRRSYACRKYVDGKRRMFIVLKPKPEPGNEAIGK